VIARGVFTSKADLQLMRFIAKHNESAKPKWSYTNPSHRITADSGVTRR
jgi:hypothetical protein